MNRTLLVLLDAGRFKAYRMEQSPRFSTPRLELLEEWESNVTRRLSDQVTDQAGQFSKGSIGFAAVSDMADGERHNLALEQHRRALKKMAARIGELLEHEGLEEWSLAAGKEINQTVLDLLPEAARQKIQRNVPANLTRLPTTEVLEHLSGADNHKGNS
jgi:hypothetical protein